MSSVRRITRKTGLGWGKMQGTGFAPVNLQAADSFSHVPSKPARSSSTCASPGGACSCSLGKAPGLKCSQHYWSLVRETSSSFSSLSLREAYFERLCYVVNLVGLLHLTLRYAHLLESSCAAICRADLLIRGLVSFGAGPPRQNKNCGRQNTGKLIVIVVVVVKTVIVIAIVSVIIIGNVIVISINKFSKCGSLSQNEIHPN